MKVKELIEKLKEFDGELEVVTYSDCDVYGTGTVNDITLDYEYDPCAIESDSRYVMIDFEWDGEV